MYKKQDPNTITKFFDLKVAGKTIGQLIADFHVVDYDDVQTQDFSSVKKEINRKFLLNCTQRIIISTENNPLLSVPNSNQSVYSDYPVLINNSIKIISSGIIEANLLEYSPKTVNTQVQKTASQDLSTGSTASNSRSTSSGSSVSETNSFGVSVSTSSNLSLMDAGVSSTVTANAEHSQTFSHEHSITSGSELSHNKNQSLSESASMNIKDWGAFSYVKQGSIPMTGWIFGQEYPWDAIRCRKTNGRSIDTEEQVGLIIPKNMLVNLYDGEALLPPSELSMFGINFVSKSLYLITLNNESDLINIDYSTLLYNATHKLNGKNVEVYIDKQPTSIFIDDPITINLPIMALDTLGLPGKQAIVGFIPSKFIVPPSPMESGKVSAFKINSASNTLYIKDTTDYSSVKDNGAGFSDSETRLIANLSEQCTSLSFTLYFKVVDTSNYYNLYLKHWKKTGSKGIKLTFTINEDSDNKIVKYVDSEEAEGAEKNLLIIALRDYNYASIDYHDYLQLGLNSIEVKIEPIDGEYSENCGYQVRAISIE